MTTVEVTDIKRIAMKAGEVLVVRVDEPGFEENGRAILKAFQDALPGVKIIVVTDDLDLQAVTEEGLTNGATS